MLKRLILTAMLGFTSATLMTACSTAFIDSERDANVRISKGATFAWGEPDTSKPAEHFADFDNPQMRTRLEASIDNFLLGKGLQRTAADKADFILTYHIGFKSSFSDAARIAAPTMVPTMRCSANRCWQTMTWGNYGSPIETREEHEYREGALIIDLRQSRTGILAYRGIYSDTLGDGSKVTDQQITEVVARTLKDAVR